MLAGPPVVHTAPSHHGFASVLCSLFSSVTLSKPHTPLAVPGTACCSLAFPPPPACWAGD